MFCISIQITFFYLHKYLDVYYVNKKTSTITVIWKFLIKTQSIQDLLDKACAMEYFCDRYSNITVLQRNSSTIIMEVPCSCLFEVLTLSCLCACIYAHTQPVTHATWSHPSNNKQSASKGTEMQFHTHLKILNCLQVQYQQLGWVQLAKMMSWLRLPLLASEVLPTIEYSALHLMACSVYYNHLFFW